MQVMCRGVACSTMVPSSPFSVPPLCESSVELCIVYTVYSVYCIEWAVGPPANEPVDAAETERSLDSIVLQPVRQHP